MESYTFGHYPTPLSGECTSPGDARIDNLIDTLRPIDIFTDADEPRIPVRKQLFDQLASLVDNSLSYNLRQNIMDEYRQQAERDRLWTNLTDAMQAAEEAERLAQDNFRTNLAIYDTAARARGIDLAVYIPPSGWEIQAETNGTDWTVGWGHFDENKTHLWVDDQTMWGDKSIAEWGYHNPTPPETEYDACTISSNSPPPLEPIIEESSDDDSGYETALESPIPVHPIIIKIDEVD